MEDKFLCHLIHSYLVYKKAAQQFSTCFEPQTQNVLQICCRSKVSYRKIIFSRNAIKYVKIEMKMKMIVKATMRPP